MKTTLLLAALLLTACQKDAQETKTSSNPAYKVKFLFEHDGIRVYRFNDRMKTLYFASKGNIQWSQSNGKSTEYLNVPTAE